MATVTMFKVARLNNDSILPKRGTDGAAGYDMCSCVDIVIPARSWKGVATGIALQVPPDHYARVAPRSGLTLKNGLDVGAGVIDSDYIGEVKVIMFNHSDTHFNVVKGDRIAQVIFEKISTPYLNEVKLDELVKTERGAGGFGSTGLSTLSTLSL